MKKRDYVTSKNLIFCQRYKLSNLMEPKDQEAAMENLLKLYQESQHELQNSNAVTRTTAKRQQVEIKQKTNSWLEHGFL